MKLVVQFDVTADLIEVPAKVVEKRESLRTRFLKWLYDPHSKHKYRVKVTDSHGKIYIGMQYRSDAFVEWLNKKVLKNSDEKAIILQEHIIDYPEDMPTVFF